MLAKLKTLSCVVFLPLLCLTVHAQSNVVGTMPGDFSVVEGTAMYSVPLTLPAGRGGMQPELSLNYASGGANGAMGLGWSLGGTSSITRCAANLAEDGFATDITFDYRSRYCLDGQRLVPISGKNGGIGTEYRTAIDTYAKIVSYGGKDNNPDYFIVRTKAGQVMTYGGDKNATQSMPQGNLRWSLRTVNDTTGNNPIDYMYMIDQNIQYLRQVSYTGGRLDIVYERGRPDAFISYLLGTRAIMRQRVSRISIRSHLTMIHQYKFSYQTSMGPEKSSMLTALSLCDRQDNCVPATTFDWSDKGSNTYGKLIGSVPVTSLPHEDKNWSSAGFHDVNGDGFDDAVWHYKGASGLRIAVSLSQGDGRYSKHMFSSPSSSANYNASTWTFAGMYDANGDDLSDAIWTYRGNSGLRIAVSLSQGNGRYSNLVYNTPSTSKTFIVKGWTFAGMYDTDGNGAVDAVWQYVGDKGTRLAVSLATENGRYGNVIFNPTTRTGTADMVNWRFVGMHDTNDDDLADGIWYYERNRRVTLAVSLAQGRGRYAETIISRPPNSTEYGYLDWDFGGIFDTNGDGIVDIAWHAKGPNNGLRLGVSLGQGNGRYGDVIYSAPVSSGSYTSADWTFIGFHDTNGDGLGDAVWQYKGRSGTRIVVSIGRGNGRYDQVIRSTPTTSSHYGSDNWEFAGMHDTNGNGLVDAVWNYQGNGDGVRLAVSLSKGNGSYEGIVYNSPKTTGSYTSVGWSFAGMYDVNGNGLADAVWQYITANNGTRVSASLSEASIPMLSQITDSNGNTTDITYALLTDSAVYTKGTGAKFPIRDVIYPLEVVSRVESDNGTHGVQTVDYHYDSLRVHLRGRESYGYARITETYLDTDKQYITYYDQRDYPYAGNILKVEERYQGDLVNVSRRTVAAKETNPGVHQLYLLRSVDDSYELGQSSPITTVTKTHSHVDVYGNIGRVDLVTTGGGDTFQSITQNRYSNDTGRWLLGRLSESKVTHKSPYGGNKVRLSRFNYHTQTGLLTHEHTINPRTDDVLKSTHHSYDSYGQKTQVAMVAEGLQSRFTKTRYNAIGQRISDCNVYAQCTQQTYTKEGWIATSTDPNGLRTEWRYDGFGRLVYERRPDATLTTTARYFANSGQCGVLAEGTHSCSVTQAGGSKPKIMQYDSAGREVRSIRQGFDERLVFSDTQYNARDLVTRVSRDYYFGDHIYWATMTYDAFDREIRATQPGPNGTQTVLLTEYDGLTTTVRNGPDSLSKITTTNALGKPILIEEEEGTSTRFTYTSSGDLAITEVDNNPDTQIKLSYDDFGRKTVVSDPDLGVWRYDYNAFGDMIKQTDKKGQVTTMSYDRLGRLVRRNETDSDSVWTYFDNTAPAGSIGKLHKSTSNQGIIHEYQYDKLSRPIAKKTTIRGEGSFTTATRYDKFSRVSRVTYPGNQRFYTENIYNENGFLERVRGPKSRAEVHDYSQLQPLVTEAVALADEYLKKADRLRNLGLYYQNRLQRYQRMNGSGQLDSSLRKQLANHKTVLSKITASATSETLLEHVNNTLTELSDIQTLLNVQAQRYSTTAAQLMVLTEQTLATADHNFQFTRSLDNAADAYTDMAADTAFINYWRAANVDASGRVSAEVYGNGLVTHYAYNQGSGQLQSIHSSLLAIDPLRHLEYQYDAYENVTLREDWVNDIRETYAYDRLDRLTRTDVSSHLYNTLAEFNTTQNVRYDTLGNITSKSGVGRYEYGAGNGGIHAVTKAGNNRYTYDKNGNMLSGNGRTITWNSFNKPTIITQAGRSVTFSYGADRARFKKVNHQGDTTLYLGKFYERVTKNDGAVEQKHYVYAGEQIVAEYIASTKHGKQTRYLHRDALGSIDLITDAYANVVDRRSFDAWGKLRKLPWQEQAVWDDPLFLSQLPFTNKAYTGHERIQEVGLIHMNGRVYDAVLSRFISADPYIQSPNLSQSYNRYSYVMNNPMKYTDPSGYFLGKALRKIGNGIKKIGKGIVKTVKKVGSGLRRTAKKLGKAIKKTARKLRPLIGTIVAAGVSSVCPTCSPFLIGAVSGAAGAIANGGNVVKEAFLGGFTAFSASFIGSNTQLFGPRRNVDLGRSLAHGAVGGAVSVARGGKFGSGFISSAFTKLVSAPIQNIASRVSGGSQVGALLAGTAGAAVVGGTASVLGGGKFANGAQTASLQYLFNQVANGNSGSNQPYSELSDDELRSLYIRQAGAFGGADLDVAMALSVRELPFLETRGPVQLVLVDINTDQAYTFSVEDYQADGTAQIIDTGQTYSQYGPELYESLITGESDVRPVPYDFEFSALMM